MQTENTKPTKEILNSWSKDPSNWKIGVFYYNKNDKRIFPPKRLAAFGWTVNFANPYSILIMLGIIVFIITVVYILQK